MTAIFISPLCKSCAADCSNTLLLPAHELNQVIVVQACRKKGVFEFFFLFTHIDANNSTIAYCNMITKLYTKLQTLLQLAKESFSVK